MPTCRSSPNPARKNKLSKRKLDKYMKNADFAKFNEHGRAIATAIGIEATAEAFNPVIVDFYEKVGYLPDAIVNYLLLLGWSLDDKTETFTRQEMIDHFSLERVNKAAASFDPQKLLAFQERYMLALPLEEKLVRVLPFLQKSGLLASAAGGGVEPTLDEIVEAAGDRIKVAGDILDYAYFFLPADQLTCDDKAFDKRVRKPPEAAELLRKFKDQLAAVESFDAPALDELMQGFVQSEAIKIGQVIHAVRVAVTGKAVGFGLFETLAILGRESCIERIDRALARL